MDFLALSVEPTAGEFHQHPAAGAAAIHFADMKSGHRSDPSVRAPLATPAGDSAAEDDFSFGRRHCGSRTDGRKQNGNKQKRQDVDSTSRHGRETHKVGGGCQDGVAVPARSDWGALADRAAAASEMRRA